MHDHSTLHNTELFKLLAQILSRDIEEQISNIQGGLRDRSVTDEVATLVAPAPLGLLTLRPDRLNKLDTRTVFGIILRTIG